MTPGKRKHKPPDLVKAAFLKDQLDNWVTDPDADNSASDAGSDPENSDEDENDGTENIAVKWNCRGDPTRRSGTIWA